MSYFGIPIRNGLPIGLGSVAPLASGGGSPFSPLSLFSGGTPGAWYDPSDYSTLFQDSAGTTPVTAVEQPVGLMLDKSQGLMLGSDVVVNGNFSGGSTGWVTTTGWTIAGGSANGVATSAFLYQTNANILVNRYYEFTFTVSNYVAGSVRPFLGATVTYGTFVSGNGTYTQRFCPTAAGNELGFGGSGFTGSIDNISVKEVTGNHAFQATSASRPVLSARYNLLTKTEQFYITGSPWFASGFSTSSTANNLIPSTSSVAHTWGQSVTATVGTALVAKLWIKPNGYNTAVMQLGGCTGTPTAFFNASTGVITSQSGSPAATMVLQPDGYYECTINGVASSATPGLTSYVVALDNTTLVFAGDGTSGLLYQKASLVPANQSTLPYQRVNTATDYAATGFLPYLKFDGVDDSLSTNSISFTSTDKMSVFAGVRKLSDAAAAIVAELSAVASTNNGAFYVAAPDSPATYGFGLRGTTSINRNASTYTAPITNVLAASYDIAQATPATEVTIRINAATPGTIVNGGVSDAGTGNFGNYPLYIGRRNNASLPFNGQMYSMIIVGKAVTAGELSSTETYVNQKTGAY
jgi:hypothetical protein